jgi:hypothetical protein
MSFSSYQTHLRWKLLRPGVRLAAGGLTWPEDFNDKGDAHAASLLAIAETGFVAGCPPATPPRSLFEHGPALSAHKLDSDERSLLAADRALAEAWRRAAARAAACRTHIEPATGPEW